MSRPEFLVQVTARPADATHCESEEGEHRCEFVGFDDPRWCGLFQQEIPSDRDGLGEPLRCERCLAKERETAG